MRFYHSYFTGQMAIVGLEGAKGDFLARSYESFVSLSKEGMVISGLSGEGAVGLERSGAADGVF